MSLSYFLRINLRFGVHFIVMFKNKILRRLETFWKNFFGKKIEFRRTSQELERTTRRRAILNEGESRVAFQTTSFHCSDKIKYEKLVVAGRVVVR